MIVSNLKKPMSKVAGTRGDGRDEVRYSGAAAVARAEPGRDLVAALGQNDGSELG